MVDKFLGFRENTLWKLLLRIQEIILVICCIVCCMIFVVEVLMRYVLVKDFLGYDEIVILFAMWMYFIGGSYCMYQKEHISADMIGLILKGRKLECSRVIVSWITLAIAVILAFWGVAYFIYASQREAVGTVWRMPLLWGQSALTIGYVLMAFYSLMYAVEDTILLFRGRKEGKEREEDVK